MAPAHGGGSAVAAPPAGGTMRRMLKAAATSGVASVVAAFTGVVRVKLFAVFLGAAGVGVISQLQNLQNSLAVLAMLGLGVGISREAARGRGAGDAGSVRAVVATGRALAGGASLLLTLGVLAFAGPLSQLLFSDPGYAWLLRLAAPALVWNTLTRVLAETLNGHADYAVNARFTVVTAVLAVVLLAPLLLAWGLAGAALALPAAALASWAIMAGMFRRARPELGWIGTTVHRSTARSLLALGAASLVMATADQVGLLGVRSRLIQLHGVQANGWFQGVWGLSQYVLNVAVAFQMTYSFARANAAPDHAELMAETNRTVRMTLLMMAPLTAAMVLLREPLVAVFLSEEFRPALPLFWPTAAGALLRAAGLAVGIGALAVAPVGAWLALGLLGSVSLVVSYLLLAAPAGIAAAPAAYALSGAVYLAAAWIVMRAYGRLRLEPRVALLLLSSAALLAGTGMVADGSPVSYVWGGLLLLGWCATAITAREAGKGIAAVARRLRRGR